MVQCCSHLSVTTKSINIRRFYNCNWMCPLCWHYAQCFCYNYNLLCSKFCWYNGRKPTMHPSTCRDRAKYYRDYRSFHWLHLLYLKVSITMILFINLATLLGWTTYELVMLLSSRAHYVYSKIIKPVIGWMVMWGIVLQ